MLGYLRSRAGYRRAGDHPEARSACGGAATRKPNSCRVSTVGAQGHCHCGDGPRSHAGGGEISCPESLSRFSDPGWVTRFRRWYMRFWSPRQRPNRLNVPLVLSGFVALHEQRFLHEPPPLTARCVHDKLLFYAVSFNTRIHPVYIPYTEAYIVQHYKQGDERGRFHTAPLTAQGIRHGHSGKPWGGVDVTARSLHWVCPTALPDGLELPRKTGSVSV